MTNLDGIEIVDDSFMEPVANPHEDRVTAILNKRAQPVQMSPDQLRLYGEAAMHSAGSNNPQTLEQILKAARQPELDQQDRELASAQGLYKMYEESRARGDKQAEMLGNSLDKITSDPDAQGKLIEWMRPALQKNPAAGRNPNSLLMLLARGKRELGIQTDFERGEQDRKFKQGMEQQRISALQSRAAGGGGSGVTGFFYNKATEAFKNAGIEITPEMDLQLLSAARNGMQKGSFITVNGQNIALENIVGNLKIFKNQAASPEEDRTTVK